MRKQFQITFTHLWHGIRGILILTGIFLVGNWVSGFMPLPVPGSVVGMVLVFCLLQFRILPLAWVDQGAVWLLSFLGLFYVPYGVGIIHNGALIGEWGIRILILISVTVLSVFAVSARIFGSLSDKSKPSDE